MPDYDSEHLINLLGAFVTTVGDDLQLELARELGPDRAGAAALLAVDTWANRSIDFLGELLGLTHSGAVRLVDRLEQQGLMERRPGADGRTAALRLTRRGQRLAEKGREARRRSCARVVNRLTEAEQQTLEVMLDRVLRAPLRSRMEAQRACRLCDHTVCRGLSCPVGMSADGS